MCSKNPDIELTILPETKKNRMLIKVYEFIYN